MTTTDTSTIFAACADQDRCVLCGRSDCAYWAAVLAGRAPAVDGAEDCDSFYRGCVSLDRLADVCEGHERTAVAS